MNIFSEGMGGILIEKLAEFGVARVSFAGEPMKVAYGALYEKLQGLKEKLP